MFIRSNASGIKQSRAGPSLDHIEPVSQGTDLRVYPAYTYQARQQRGKLQHAAGSKRKQQLKGVRAAMTREAGQGLGVGVWCREGFPEAHLNFALEGGQEPRQLQEAKARCRGAGPHSGGKTIHRCCAMQVVLVVSDSSPPHGL